MTIGFDAKSSVGAFTEVGWHVSSFALSQAPVYTPRLRIWG